MNEAKCPIWQTPCEIYPSNRDAEDVYSPRAGGRYEITGDALVMLSARFEDTSKVKLSRWIYTENLLGGTPEVDSQILGQVKRWPMPSVSTRMDYFLQFLESKINVIGQSVHISEVGEEMLAATSSKAGNELQFFMEQAHEMGLVKRLTVSWSLTITIAGYRRLEELRGIQALSDQAFVAMWFHVSMNEALENGFEPGIEDAGYKPFRIDRKHHNNKIDDEIIAEVRRSRFLVADFTSEPEKARGGVYYEAGFAHGLNIPVIFACREDLINTIHFDTRQFNHIVWEKPEDLRKKLKNRISATVGDGPHRSKT